MDDKKDYIHLLFKSRYAVLFSLIWCAFMALLCINTNSSNIKHMDEQVLTQARTLYRFILDTRNWNAKHGGVYVRESDYGPANEWIPEEKRSITMPDGSRFVLVNPAYMSRQISEDSNLSGANFKIISAKPLRPENMADTWELQAFERNANGEDEVYSYIHGDVRTNYRYLKPLYALESCLKCHNNIKVDNVLGGISVNLDVTELKNNVITQNKNIIFIYTFMALAGSFCIGGASFLRQRKEQMRETEEKMKEAFVANMSHDMRTPLAGILGMTELLQQENLPTKNKKTIEYLQLAGASLLEMVSDITDYAALNAGKIILNERTFDLRDDIEQCCALFTPQCTAKGLIFELNFTENMPKYVLGDPFRIRQILGNLINNAIKFTQSGTVSVHVAFSNDILRLEVQDTGLGIAKKDQKKIFSRFERGAAEGQSDTPGTGLGLTIVWEIVELMQGRIELISNEGEGACFIVQIALKTDTALPALEHEKRDLSLNNANEIKQVKANVLVVEDNSITAFFVQSVLEKIGCTVKIAPDGIQALDYLSSFKADIILLDMRMLPMDGLATAQKIRTMSGFNDVPIILMSASVLDIDATKLQELRIAKTMIKPVPAQDIIELVQNFMPQKCFDLTQEPPLFERDKALDLLDDNEQLLNNLLNVWLNEFIIKHEELLKAVGEKNYSQIHNLAHSIKNSAGILCLSQLSYEAAKVEKAVVQNSEVDCKKLIASHTNTYNYLTQKD